METQNIFMLAKTEELLQYFTSDAVTFAQTDSSLSATGIGTGLTAGDIILIAASSEADNNTEKTVATVTANKITVEEAIVDDTPGETIKIKQVVYSGWCNVSAFAKIVGTITSSGDCAAIIQQSMDGVNVDHASSAISVTGGTSKEIDQAVYCKYARLKITNGEADQTLFRAYMNGRSGS